MPGWPNAGRADDHRLVEALRRVDGQAPVDLYDAYAERLHDYARTLLPDPAAAAEAVHDALVTAHGCVRRLGDARPAAGLALRADPVPVRGAGPRQGDAAATALPNRSSTRSPRTRSWPRWSTRCSAS